MAEIDVPPMVAPGAEFAFGKSPFHAKGVLYLGTQSYFTEHVRGAMQSLENEIKEPELRAFITQRFLPASLYDVTPVPTLIAYEARAQRMSLDSYLLHRTRYQAKKDLGGVHGWLLRLATPRLIARSLPRIMLQMFDFAKVEIVRDEPNEVVAKMMDVPELLAPWLQVGLAVYSESALKLAGARPTAGTTEVRRTTVRAGLQLVEMIVPLAWK